MISNFFFLSIRLSYVHWHTKAWYPPTGAWKTILSLSILDFYFYIPFDFSIFVLSILFNSIITYPTTVIYLRNQNSFIVFIRLMLSHFSYGILHLSFFFSRPHASSIEYLYYTSCITLSIWALTHNFHC